MERISLEDAVRWPIGEEDAAVAALHASGSIRAKRRPKQYRPMN
jgi:hypothetical protein